MCVTASKFGTLTSSFIDGMETRLEYFHLPINTHLWILQWKYNVRDLELCYILQLSFYNLVDMSSDDYNSKNATYLKVHQECFDKWL